MTLSRLRRARPGPGPAAAPATPHSAAHEGERPGETEVVPGAPVEVVDLQKAYGLDTGQRSSRPTA